MAKNQLTPEQKKLDTDLWIIFIVTFAAYGLFAAFQEQIYAIIRDGSISVIPRVLLGALCQFGLAGLGISIVCLLRKESFASFGLHLNGTLKSILLCSLCFVPYLVFSYFNGNLSSWLPFQSVLTTRDVLASSFPVNVLGMLITAIAWGFFEGFNYVVICDKINGRYPGKNFWVDWGAIFCAIMCILIHGAVGVSAEGIIEMLSVIIIIYGMLMVKKYTGNAWGCVFVFVFLWNAF